MTWKPLPPDCKAAEVWLEFVDDPNTKYFLLEGAVRSSKTFGSILAWCDWVENFAPPGPLIMMGNTRETLIQNVLDPLIDLVGKQAILNRGIGQLTLFGRPIYIFGAGNIAAMRKLQGKGAVGAYCDEAPTYPKDVWQMLGTRAAADGIKIIATMNPDSPMHWMKKDYLDRLKAVNGRSWHFTLDDNPFLSEKVKNELKSQYTGLWKRRYIDGLWVMAEGSVYDMWDEEKHVLKGPLPPMTMELVGVDYGTSNPTAFLKIGRTQDGKWIVAKEFYYSSENGRQKTDLELSKDMITFLADSHPASIMVDPSAASLKAQLRALGVAHVTDADNSVINGIRTVATMLSSGRLLIHESCKHLIEEIPGYVWDSAKQQQGLDAPMKTNDHCCDALRYVCMRAMQRRFN